MIIPESHFQEPESPRPQVPANPRCQESADWDFTVYWRTGQWLDVTRGSHLAKQHSCSAEKASSLCHHLQRLAGDVLNKAVYWIQIIWWTGVVKVFEFCIDRDKRAHNLKRKKEMFWWTLLIDGIEDVEAQLRPLLIILINALDSRNWQGLFIIGCIVPRLTFHYFLYSLRV